MKFHLTIASKIWVRKTSTKIIGSMRLFLFAPARFLVQSIQTSDYNYNALREVHCGFIKRDYELARIMHFLKSNTINNEGGSR